MNETNDNISRRKALFQGATVGALVALAGGARTASGAANPQAGEGNPRATDTDRLSNAQTIDARSTSAPLIDGASTRPAFPLVGSQRGNELLNGHVPVVTPNLKTLPHKLVDEVKVFHLIAEEIEHEFAPGIKAFCWGYNGSTPGPTIEAVEGDRVRIYVTNRLPASTSVHWHGLILPNGMDGVGGLSHKPIDPGETYKYEFTLAQHGTHMYHSHHDEMTQMALGLVGSFVIHPKAAPGDDAPQRDYVYQLGEWSLPVGAKRPDPNEMTDFNLLTLNGRVFPGTQPLVARWGERVRIRFGNLSAMDHHPIHLHGYTFTITQTDGGVIPPSARWPEVTVLVPTGATRTIEFVAEHNGDWALHCHMTHHVMNQMGHDIANMTGVDVGAFNRAARKVVPGYMTMGQHGMADMGEMGMTVPDNSIPMMGGVGPHGYITMGGMFTILKVRDELPAGDADPGWYENPPGTQAMVATAEELKRDGIEIA